MPIVSLDDNCRLTLPPQVVERLGLKPGRQVDLSIDEAGRLVLTPLADPLPAPSLRDAVNRKNLELPLQFIKGVGPRLSAALGKKGIFTVEDALYLLPHRYEDRRDLRPLAKLRPGVTEVFTGEVVSAETATTKNGRRYFEAILKDQSGTLVCKWFNFNAAFMKKAWQPGRHGIFTGEVTQFGFQREVHHPEVEWLAEGEEATERLARDASQFGRIVPVYPLTEGVQQRTMRLIMKAVVEGYASAVATQLPTDIRERHRLLPLNVAVTEAHLPKETDDLKLLNEGGTEAHKTLVFDEFFYLELGLALKKRGITMEEGIAFNVTHRYTKELLRLLPFQLTAAQRRVLSEIKADMMAPHPMHRLVQGDVGSGKFRGNSRYCN